SEPNPENRYTSFRDGGGTGDPLSYYLMLGEYNRSLHAYIRAEDRHRVLRSRNSLRLDRSDALHIALVNREGGFERYVIAPYEDEFVYAYRVGQDLNDVGSFSHEPRINGRF